MRDGIVPEKGAGRASPSIPWAELLRRSFGKDVLRCPTCGGKRFRIALITDPRVIARILSHIGLKPRPEPLAPIRPPPDPVFDF